MKRIAFVLCVLALTAAHCLSAEIPNGSLDQYIQFVGMQSADPTAAFTGGTSFTVKYIVNGGTLTTMTTPTVTEKADGLYVVLCDESGMTTIPDSNDTANLLVQIAHAGMVTVWREATIREPMATIAQVQADLATDAKQDTIIGYVDGIEAKTNNIPAAPAATGDIPTAGAIADAVWDEATSGHTTAGTTGKALTDAGTAGDPWSTALPGSYTEGTAGYILGNAATAGDAADAIWDELLSGHADVGSAGAALSAAGSAGDPWSTVLPGSYGEGTAGKAISDILTDTAEIGVAGAGLTAIPWNSAWDAEAQSEATDALNAYDPPTNAEMEARTLVAASYFDPTTDDVYLADGAHGGSAATLTMKQVAVTNTDAGGVAVSFTGSGTGNSHALQLTSTNGKALAAGSTNSDAVSINSTNANGMVVVGATGDIVSDITGQVSGMADLLPDGFADNTMTDGKLDVNATVGDVTIEGNVDLTPEAIDAIFNEVIKGAHEVYGTLGWYLNAILGGQ